MSVFYMNDSVKTKHWAIYDHKLDKAPPGSVGRIVDITSKSNYYDATKRDYKYKVEFPAYPARDDYDHLYYDSNLEKCS